MYSVQGSKLKTELLNLKSRTGRKTLIIILRVTCVCTSFSLRVVACPSCPSVELLGGNPCPGLDSWPSIAIGSRTCHLLSPAARAPPG